MSGHGQLDSRDIRQLRRFAQLDLRQRLVACSAALLLVQAIPGSPTPAATPASGLISFDE
jgi:hypothetical protein